MWLSIEIIVVAELGLQDFPHLPLGAAQGFWCFALSQIQNKMNLSPILSTFFFL